jgi:D-serine deaminase-like pyridoxal phosphate-dependent protein
MSASRVHPLDFLTLRNVGAELADLHTPVPIIDISIVARNITRWQARCDALGLANRPHIKTHKLSGLARYQLASGARGITVQTLGEAEAMAAAGITDMLLTFNIIGRPKLHRLSALIKGTDIAVVADHREMLEGLSLAARRAGRRLSVLVECDTGAARNGVQSPLAALALAQEIERSPDLRFGGLMTYPAPGQRLPTAAFLNEAKQLCQRSGLNVAMVTSGGSPDMWRDDGLSGITEYRVGTYVYFDRSLVARGSSTWDDCALSVLSTVVSRPTPERAIIDAGTKALTSDLLGLQGYGIVQDLDEAPVYAANEEHGFLDLSASSLKPKVGDLVRITPNHVCPVSNLFEEVVFIDGDRVLGAVRVDARSGGRF